MSSYPIWREVDELAFHENAVVLEALARSQEKDLELIRKAKEAEAPDLLWARDFLDDFALFAAGSGEASNVAAPSLESSNTHNSLTVRLAKNEDFDMLSIERLSQLVDVMNQVKQRDVSLVEGKKRCFDLIAQSCRARILRQVTGENGLCSLVSDHDTSLENIPEKVKYSSNAQHSESREDIESIGKYDSDTHETYLRLAQNRWLEMVQIINELQSSSDLDTIKSLARLAYDVRRSTSFNIFLEIAFQAKQYHCAKVREKVGKIAKFLRGAVTFTQVATNADLGSKCFRFEVIPSRSRRIGALAGRTVMDMRKRSPLLSERLAGNASKIQRLLRRWRKYIVHAEMSLLLFYEEHPDLNLATNYVGISKRSCWLCANFIRLHDRFAVEGQHQQLYCLWTLPVDVKFASETNRIRFTQTLMELQHLLEAKVASISTHPYRSVPYQKESVANFSRITLLAQTREVPVPVTDLMNDSVTSHRLQTEVKEVSTQVRAHDGAAMDDTLGQPDNVAPTYAKRSHEEKNRSDDPADATDASKQHMNSTNHSLQPKKWTTQQLPQTRSYSTATVEIDKPLSRHLEEKLPKPGRPHRQHRKRSGRAIDQRKPGTSTMQGNPRPGKGNRRSRVHSPRRKRQTVKICTSRRRQ